MQQQIQCPRCKSPISYGAPSCSNCGQTFIWQHQPQQPVQTPQYQQQYQQPDSGYQQQTKSICVNCRCQNHHGVDHNGEAFVTCQSCATVYNVKTYQIRAKGGRRDRTSGIKSYSVRVKEPDRDETLLNFDSLQEIELRAGDWITGSYFEGKLKYLLNQNIRQYWDVREGMDRKGCTTVILMITVLITAIIIPVVYWL